MQPTKGGLVSRTGKRKLICGLWLLLAAGLGLWFATRAYIGIEFKLAAVLLLLMPGRLHGLVFRDLYTALRAFNQGQYEISLGATKNMLEGLARHPWKGHQSLAWFGVYSRSVHSLAFNNLGAAHLCLGQLDEAERALRSAIEHDTLNPLPYFNLAVLERLREAPQQSDEFARRSQELGYTGSVSDAVVQRVDAIYARLEGRGAPTQT